MTTLCIVMCVVLFLGLLVFACLTFVALQIAVEERERWFVPLKPVEFEYLDADVEVVEDER